jgi:hypothetical protein
MVWPGVARIIPCDAEVSMELKAGSRLHSAVCATEVIVVRPPKGAVDLRCGGQPMLPHGTEAAAGRSIDPAFASGSLIGKRYASEELGLELLVTKAGDGTLAVGDTPIELKDAKPLPSSD